jgi:type I restriction enzyme, S subunit
VGRKYNAKTSVDSVRREMISKMMIPVPKIEEQQKIASILSTVDEQIEVYEQEKAKYEELKKGLMQQLLTGKVRVKI